MRLTKRFLACSLAIGCVLAPVSALAQSVTGFISGSIYNRDDDVAAQDFSITRVRIRLNVEELIGDGTALRLKGATRSSGSGTFSEDIPGARFETAKLEFKQAFSLVDIHLGRQYIDYMPTARLDGANIVYPLGETSGVGLFGGLEPDPYDDIVNGDYMMYGLYGFTNNPTAGVSGGYVMSTFKGGDDKSYLYGSGYYNMSESLRLYGTARSDHNADSGGNELTNFYLSANFIPNENVSLDFSYNQYRAIRLFESMDYDLNHELQTTLRAAGRVKVTKTMTIYGSFDTRTRESDGKSASLIWGGLKQTDFFNWFYYDVAFRSINYFTSDIIQYFGAIGADVDDNLSVEANVTFMTNEQEGTSNTLEQWIYGFSADWYPGNTFFVSGSIELSNEEYLDIDSIALAKTSDKFNAVTYFLYAGYRF